jgi:hypothetical protein
MRECWRRMLWGPTTAGSNVVSPCAVRDLSLIENENQDTVSLLEKCVDVDKRGTRLPEAKRYSVESTEVMKWQRYMDEVKKWDDSRLPLVGGYMRETVAATV